MQHVRPLDGLRAVAILIVMLSHCGWGDVVPGGFGVTVFFFLSGYLITSLLRSEMAQAGRIDLRGFYFRRTLRIWPSLYLTLAFTLLLARWVPHRVPVEPAGVLAQLAFVSNYAGLWSPAAGAGAPWMPLWSLAVEEHFYLLFPLLFAGWLGRLPPARAAAWCLAGCALVLAGRLASLPLVADPGSLYYWSHTRIDSILFGCCLALWRNPVLDRPAWRPRPWQVAAALAVLLACLAVRDEAFRQTARYSLQGAALFVLFAAAIGGRGPVARLLGAAPLRLVATYSYTLYLVHVPLLELAHHLVPALPPAGLFVVGGGAALAYAAAMYRLVEQPAQRWRRRLHRVDARVDDLPAVAAG